MVSPSAPPSVPAPSQISVRGFVEFLPRMKSIIFNPSTGGRPAAAPRLSKGSFIPATDKRLVYISSIAMRPVTVAPRLDTGTSPPLIKAFTRTPPSKFECFPPRSG